MNHAAVPAGGACLELTPVQTIFLLCQPWSRGTRAGAGARPPAGVPTVGTRGQALIFPGPGPLKQEQGLHLGELGDHSPRSGMGSRGGSCCCIPATVGSGSVDGEARPRRMQSGLRWAWPGSPLRSPALSGARGACRRPPAQDAKGGL